MFSLDLVRWRQAKDEHTTHFQKKFIPPRAQAQEKHVKQIYGKTTKEMYANYLERVNQWMIQAPSQDWTKLYGKELDHAKTNHSPFRDRNKSKELGDAMIHTGKYIPRGIFTGGGVCVSSKYLHDKEEEAHEEDGGDDVPHEIYQPPIQGLGRTREKHKEIQPPMSIPKNKTLEVAHYFVQDIISSSPSSKSIPTLEPLPSDAESVSSPVWRLEEPQKWIDQKGFKSTVKSQNIHTAQFKGLGGETIQASILSSDPYPKIPGEAVLSGERPPRMLAPLSSKHCPKHRQQQQEAEPEERDRKYFNSMLTNGSNSFSSTKILLQQQHHQHMSSSTDTSTNSTG